MSFKFKTLYRSTVSTGKVQTLPFSINPRWHCFHRWGPFSSSLDANRTFEIFVKQDDTDFDERNLADDTGRINEIFQSTGTQTVDSTQYDGNSSYFSHRENKRVDEQVRRAQRAHYNAYLKQLSFKQEQESTQKIQRHPPSKPPAVKKPVTTQRMARYECLKTFVLFGF